MTLPPYYANLYRQNPAAYLVELVMAELVLRNFVDKEEAEVEFEKLSKEQTGKCASGELENFLRFLFSELKATPPQEPFPLSKHGKALLAKMEEAHRQLSAGEGGNQIYRILYLRTLPALIDLRGKTPELKEQGEVSCYFSVVFATIVLEMSGKPVSKATGDAAVQFSNLLNILGELMMKKPEASATSQIDASENSPEAQAP